MYLLSLIVQRCNCSVHPLMPLIVNTYASSVIESSFASMKFMEVLMNVHLPCIVSTVGVNECIFCVNEHAKGVH